MGGKPENCVTFLSPKGVKRTAPRDLSKIFQFCKMFWIDSQQCLWHSELKKLLISFISFLPSFKKFDVVCRKLPQRNHLRFKNANWINLVTVKVSRKNRWYELEIFWNIAPRYWITVYLLDTQLLFQECFLSVVRNDVLHLHYLIIVYNGNKVDGRNKFQLRSRKQLKHCLKHSQIGPSRWRINKQLKG